MKKSCITLFVSTLALVAGMVSVGSRATVVGASIPEAQISPVTPDLSRASTVRGIPDPTFVERGSFRSLLLGAEVSDGAAAVYEVTSEVEMDVSSVTFSAGISSAGAIFQGYAYLNINANTSTSNYPFFISSTGTETIQLTFPDPIPMRAGDQVIFFPFAANGGLNAIYRLSMTGTSPRAAKVTGVIVR